jgi:hypothetical protein
MHLWAFPPRVHLGDLGVTEVELITGRLGIFVRRRQKLTRHRR